jgi:hypothetical protein
MPGAVTPSFPTHDDGADEDYVGDSEVPESIPLVLLSELEPARRDAVTGDKTPCTEPVYA